MTELLDIRATKLPAEDVDYLRPFARNRGHGNTGTAVVRFAVSELAERLRAEAERSRPRIPVAASAGHHEDWEFP